MKLSVELDLRNTAFGEAEYTAWLAAWILRSLSNDIEANPEFEDYRDAKNANNQLVGRYKFS